MTSTELKGELALPLPIALQSAKDGPDFVKTSHPELSESQLAILWELRALPSISRKLLSKRFNIRAATLDTEIDDLVNKGLIT